MLKRLLFCLAAMTIVAPAAAAEFGTKEEAVAMAKRVQEHFRKDGPEITFKAVSDKPTKAYHDRDLLSHLSGNHWSEEAEQVRPVSHCQGRADTAMVRVTLNPSLIIRDSMETTVLKALRVLEALASSEAPVGVSELGARLGLTKANAHRLLRTLLSAGYVAQDAGTGRYRLTLRMWETGVAVLRGLDLTEVARPRLRGLSDAADESVQLAVLQQGSVVYIDKADSRHPLRATTQIGGRVPAYCVSTGKALLASSGDALGQLRFPLPRHTARTIVSRARLETELAQVRRQGYAVNRGEWREGIWGIAAPIHEAGGSVVAAIGVWGPELRFRGPALSRLARLVVAAAGEISTLLGHCEAQAVGSRNTRR